MLQGVEKAQMVGFLDWNQPDSKFNVAKYEFYEQVNNGDWNWIVPGKLLAVSGPSARRVENYGYRMLSCQDYWETFHKEGVTTVVRLNKKVHFLNYSVQLSSCAQIHRCRCEESGFGLLESQDC